MTHITACIVALTLTGSPVTSAVCATICGHESAPTAHCHESLTQPAPAAMSGEATCAAATVDAPYVKESVAAPQAVTVAVSPALPVPESSALPAFAPGFSPASSWLAPPFVLRL